MSLRRLAGGSDELPAAVDIAEWAAKAPDGLLTVGRGKHHLRLDPAAAPRLLSRTHCTLRLDGADLLVTDLGSTNGTFYSRPSDGENVACAPPHEAVRLPPGSNIYFGGGVMLDVDGGPSGARHLPNPAAYVYMPPPGALSRGPTPGSGGPALRRSARLGQTPPSAAQGPANRGGWEGDARQPLRERPAGNGAPARLFQSPRGAAAPVNGGSQPQQEQQALQVTEGREQQHQPWQQQHQPWQQQQQQEQQVGRPDAPSAGARRAVTPDDGARPAAGCRFPGLLPESQDSMGSRSVGSRPNQQQHVQQQQQQQQEGEGDRSQQASQHAAERPDRRRSPSPDVVVVAARLGGSPNRPAGSALPPQQQRSPSPEDALAAEATCAICRELFLAPFTLQPCGHVFCGACLQDWLRRKAQCPSCRAQVVAPPVPNRTVANIADLLAGRGGGGGAGGGSGGTLQSARAERLQQWRAVEEAVKCDWQRVFSVGARGGGGGDGVGGGAVSGGGAAGSAAAARARRSGPAARHPVNLAPARGPWRNAAMVGARGRAAGRGSTGSGVGGRGLAGRRARQQWQIPLDALFPPQ